MEQQTAQAKHIPYGMQNWEDVRLDNYYYVDKTRFIPKIEAANRYFFFIRPRRFGKSLLLNMLRQYYDVRKADLFDRLFGDLWIGSHPTPMHNKYLVLHLNFAMFSGDLAGYKERMDDYCNTQYVFFIDQYADLLPPDAQEKLLNIYRKLKHSYLIELKYLPAKATDAEVKVARQQAVEQLTRYGESVQVERTVFTTQLHRLILLWRGMELAVAEEL